LWWFVALYLVATTIEESDLERTKTGRKDSEEIRDWRVTKTLGDGNSIEISDGNKP
jgi:hypothetical protein